MEEIQKEKQKLNITLDIIRELLKTEQVDLTDLYKNFFGSREELWRMADSKKIHISNLETSLERPYFARIDFVSDDDGNVRY